MNKWRKLSLLGIGISLITIVAIIYFTIDRESLDYLAHISPWVIVLIILLHTGGFISNALRLKVLTAATGNRVRFTVALEAGLASSFMAAVTPSQMGGEPLRISILHKEGVKSGSGSAIVFGERVMDLLFFILVVPVLILFFGAGIFEEHISFLFGIAFFILLVVIILYLGVFKPESLKRFSRRLLERKRKKKGDEYVDRKIAKVEREIDNFNTSFRTMMKHIPHFIAALGLTSITWLLNFSIPSVILLGFGLDPMWIYSISAQVIIYLIATVPLTPGSSGVVEITMLALYGAVPSSIIGVFILLWRLSTYYYNLVVGGIVSVKILKEYGVDEDGSGDKGESEQ